MEQELFKGQREIAKIGGKMWAEYMSLKRLIMFLNDEYFKLLSNLWLTDDKDLVIDLLVNNLTGLKETYIKNVIQKVDAGKIPKENLLSKKTQDLCRSLTTEERIKLEKKEMHRALSFRYNEIYHNSVQYCGGFLYSPKPLKICRNALYITPYGIGINANEFITIYKDFTKADQSITGKMHKEAANAINRFFNGIEITEKEFSKYFTIENGKIIANPTSINQLYYSRLGKRARTEP